MKIFNSLQTKLTASFVLLILAVTSLTFLITFRETKSALKEVAQTELKAVASVIASQLHGRDGDAIQNLRPGDEESSEFKRCWFGSPRPSSVPPLVSSSNGRQKIAYTSIH